jgi:hypothetical protein
MRGADTNEHQVARTDTVHLHSWTRAIVIVGGKPGLLFFLALAQKSALPRLLRCTLHFRNGSFATE